MDSLELDKITTFGDENPEVSVKTKTEKAYTSEGELKHKVTRTVATTSDDIYVLLSGAENNKTLDLYVNKSEAKKAANLEN